MPGTARFVRGHPQRATVAVTGLYFGPWARPRYGMCFEVDHLIRQIRRFAEKKRIFTPGLVNYYWKKRHPLTKMAVPLSVRSCSNHCFLNVDEQPCVFFHQRCVFLSPDFLNSPRPKLKCVPNTTPQLPKAFLQRLFIRGPVEFPAQRPAGSQR